MKRRTARVPVKIRYQRKIAPYFYIYLGSTWITIAEKNCTLLCVKGYMLRHSAYE